MSTNPLNDISKVYLEQVAESAVPGKPAERLGAVTAIPKAEQEAARERLLAKAAAKRAKMKEENEIDEAVKGTNPEMRRAASAERRSGDKKLAPSTGKGYADQQKQSIAYMDKVTKKNKNIIGLVTKEGLDPVGKEDKDIDNDGDHDKTDKYLLNRRKVRGAAIAKKSVKEGYSNWREELSEVAEYISKDKNDEKIVEKKVKNKIKINPNMGEAVENLGGTLIEMVEIDEVDYIVESVYVELLDEGYEEDDIEEALEFALTEAKVTFGHDTPTGQKKKGNLVAAVGRLARQKLASKVRGAKSAARRAVSSGARKVAAAATKIADRADTNEKHAKRNTAKGHEEIMRNNREYQTAGKSSGGYRNVGVGRKEKVSSGSYTAPTKKKAEKPSDPWEGSATTPPKAKKKKAAAPKAKTTKVSGGTAKAPARKKKSKLDDLLASVRSEEVQINEKTLTSAETKKKEELVKSMKDKAADFEKRYPGRGKEVMYATATKMAKKIAEQAMEMPPKTPEKEKPLDTAAERQKYTNLKMLQQKKQQLERQKLNLQKQGKLPLEAD